SARGYRLIAGIDEAGRGALAGPVVAAAVILPQSPDFPWLKSVRDSKEVPPARREFLFDLIRQDAIAVSVGIIAPQTIDVIGILNATKIAMCHAVAQLSHPPDFLLIDYLRLPQLRISQKPIVRGDKLCLSIACASIIAKVTRDRIMVELDQLHPGYGLAHHKGYGTKQHVSCLHQHGPSPIHRHSFAPVREAARIP
ncbi:MAG: ribonuclease HII, partial [Dehalococcoidia bacterium]|nr:ribonuclease HII [Dehalococcoidia bacterium]